MATARRVNDRGIFCSSRNIHALYTSDPHRVAIRAFVESLAVRF
jgi:hypothetical protein